MSRVPLLALLLQSAARATSSSGLIASCLNSGATTTFGRVIFLPISAHARGKIRLKSSAGPTVS